MGQQISKEEMLYQQVNYGNVEGIKSLRRDGAGLEWIDSEGKTPLIMACMKPDFANVAKVLIELGANVNAYRPGSHAGTPLHHAAKRGLDHTVHLLIHHGANPFIMNDDCQTPLDVARSKGHSNVVRVIEAQIQLFSGWLRELHGPGFLEALARQWVSRTIWAVVIPRDSRNPQNPTKFELAIYPTREVAQPRTVIQLWKTNIEEVKFHQPDPAVVIFDKSTKTRHKLLAANEGDKKQLLWFYNACRGIRQFTAPSPAVLTAPEDLQLAMAINASIQSAMQERPAVFPTQHGSGASDMNGWASSTNTASFNGWGPQQGLPHPSKPSNGGSVDIPASGGTYSGWGAPDVVPAPSFLPPSSVSSSGSVDTYADGRNHNGWGASDGGPSQNILPPLKPSSSGSVDMPATGGTYNGWGAQGGGANASETKHQQYSVLGSCASTLSIPQGVPSVPSAPPIPADSIDEGSPICYPCIDSSLIDFAVPAAEMKPLKNEDGNSSGSCVICLDAPRDVVCVPCGHVVGCMSCLSGIKTKNLGCPICRAKIDQIVKIFNV